MKKYLRLFLIIFLMMIFIDNVKAEDYKTGDLIEYKNIKFYVVEDKGEYLTLLKATPLNLKELQNYTQYTTSSAGFGEYYMGYLLYCKKNGNCSFELSTVKEALDNWSKQLDDKDLVEDEVTYSDYNDDMNKNITKSYKVRLLTLKELIQKFGYIKENNSYYSSLKTPKWITNYGYWIMDYMSDNKHYNVSEGYGNSFLDFSFGSSLRPVINLSKKASITKLKSAIKSITDEEFKIGDIVDYNNVEYYVIKDSNKNDKKVTMIKRMPLTQKEIEKYDSKYISIGTQYEIYDEENDSVSTYKYIPYYYQKDSCEYSISSSGCKNDYESSDIKRIVDMWANEHVKLNELIEDETGYKTRIISLNDLTNNLKYVSTIINENDEYHQQMGLPFNLIDCWTMTPAAGTTDTEYKINKFKIGQTKIVYTGVVCPVITVNKQKATQPLEKSKVTIPNTLLNNSVFIVVIGIILIVVSTIVISVILKKRHK